MPADPRAAGAYLSRGASALAALAPAITAVSGPGGLAVGILAALAGIAGDVLQGPQATVTLAEDPGPLLRAMHEHWQRRRP